MNGMPPSKPSSRTFTTFGWSMAEARRASSTSMRQEVLSLARCRCGRLMATSGGPCRLSVARARCTVAIPPDGQLEEQLVRPQALRAGRRGASGYRREVSELWTQRSFKRSMGAKLRRAPDLRVPLASMRTSPSDLRCSPSACVPRAARLRWAEAPSPMGRSLRRRARRFAAASAATAAAPAAAEAAPTTTTALGGRRRPPGRKARPRRRRSRLDHRRERGGARLRRDRTRTRSGRRPGGHPRDHHGPPRRRARLLRRRDSRTTRASRETSSSAGRSTPRAT